MSGYVIETHALTKTYGKNTVVKQVNIHVKHLWPAWAQRGWENNDYENDIGAFLYTSIAICAVLGLLLTIYSFRL